MPNSQVTAGNLYGNSPSLSQALDAFRLKVVDLTGADYKWGHEMAGQIMSAVATTAAQYPGLPHIYRAESFLAGSLGRRTKERPLDDIDLYLVVNGGPLFMQPDGYTVPVTLYGSPPNPLAEQPQYVDGGWVSSWLMLYAFQAPVSQVAEKAGATFGISSKKKTLYLRWSDLNVDLGFVLWGQASSQGEDRYYLPKGNGEPWWSRTNPKLDQERLTEGNKAGGGHLIPLIRIMKWWNRHRNQDRLKGIHLEVMIENAFAKVGPYPLFPALCYAFQQLHTMVMQSCPDPTSLGALLDSSLSNENRFASRQQLETDRNCMTLAAYEVQKGNEHLAANFVRYVFPI